MYNQFAKEKSDFLGKKDKGKKGSIDKDAIRLVAEINSKDEYYTTSSCGGRILLLESKSRKKNECNWIFAKHDKVKFSEIFHLLNSKKFRHEVWFRQQPLILHVACRNLDAARKILESSRKIFKRAGIISITRRKIMVEIIGDERIETIIADKNFIADKIIVVNLLKYANRNFMENKRKIRRFLRLLIA